MQKLKNKPRSILKIKHISESEDDDGNEEMELVENDSNQSEGEDVVENNNSDFELEPELEDENSKQKKPDKIRKKGIVYIGSIPEHMNVAICRELMEQFGEVGRIFLQPDKKGSKLFSINQLTL